MLLPRRTVAGFFTRSVVKVPRCLWIARIFVFVSLYNGRVSGALRYVEVCQFFPLYIGAQNNGFSWYNPSRKVMYLCLCMITYCLCTQQTVCLSLSKATFRSPFVWNFFSICVVPILWSLFLIILLLCSYVFCDNLTSVVGIFFLCNIMANQLWAEIYHIKRGDQRN